MPSGIPDTPKRFYNWLERQRLDLPAELYILGYRRYLVLRMIELNRNIPGALRATKKHGAEDMRKFMAAYAEWKSAQK